MTLADVRIDTPRLLLRELAPADAEPLAEIEGNPDVARYLTFDPRSVDDEIARIADSIRDRQALPRLTYDLAVELKDAGRLVGRCGFAIRRPEHREAEIWWILSPSTRGRGLATEAATSLLQFAFERAGCHRVFADCDPRNTASCALALRLGMKHEGRLRQNYFLKGEWCDADIFGMLEFEWRPLGA